MPRSKDAVTVKDEPALEVDTEGLVAVGGTLDPDLLEEAYRRGIFPWSSDPAITWWCPDPRAVFELEDFHVARLWAYEPDLCRTDALVIAQFLRNLLPRLRGRQNFNGKLGR